MSEPTYIVTLRRGCVPVSECTPLPSDRKETLKWDRITGFVGEIIMLDDEAWTVISAKLVIAR